MDIGGKLNVHRTLIRHPGRFRNVLCMFNLPPVSRSQSTVKKDELDIFSRVEGQIDRKYFPLQVARRGLR